MKELELNPLLNNASLQGDVSSIGLPRRASAVLSLSRTAATHLEVVSPEQPPKYSMGVSQAL